MFVCVLFLVNPWVIENAEQLSPAQIEDVRRILAEEHGQIPEVAIGEAAQAQTEATQQNEPSKNSKFSSHFALHLYYFFF
jgi:prophage DNA circulation protein